MTVPSERTHALIHTYELLRRLQDPKETQCVPRWLRGHAKAARAAGGAGRMHSDGYQFTCTNNGVWLMFAVPTRFITLVSDW